jgi:FAD/FMN-containing dehydrogenase
VKIDDDIEKAEKDQEFIESVTKYVRDLNPVEVKEHLILISQNPWVSEELRENIKVFTNDV